ncbi:MAG: hypothetical protein QF570_17400 [Myxococcota bacterium]|nr:hypothetical protein [Myxococcota bacterium]
MSAFVGGSVSKIKALDPDLAIGFSDIQADLARELIVENLQVLIFNQRSLREIMGVIVDEAEVEAADPQIMLASWCGKVLDAASVYARETMGSVEALRERRLVEVPAEIILQPGPACLTDGLDRLVEIISGFGEDHANR